MKGPPSFWEDPEQVERSAARDADHRLVALLDETDPAGLRALDVGCAGGRNTDLLARRGVEVHALDASRAMVERTRQRLAEHVGSATATARVRRGRMDDLTAYADASFDLVIALGVFHAAESRAEWERAADETARVLVPRGLLLFSQFTPETDLTGQGLTPVEGEPGVYEGLPGGRAVLLRPHEIDAAFARRSLTPVTPTYTATTALESGRRVSANGFYRRG
jgi:SAM-dependent methyltransferase